MKIADIVQHARLEGLKRYQEKPSRKRKKYTQREGGRKYALI